MHWNMGEPGPPEEAWTCGLDQRSAPVARRAGTPFSLLDFRILNGFETSLHSTELGFLAL